MIPTRFLPGFFLTIFLLQSSLFAQKTPVTDTVLLLNGIRLTGKITSDLGEYYRFEWDKSPGKTKSLAIEKLEIFSITNSDHQKSILYSPDSLLNRTFSISQMQDYIEGERTADLFYKPRLPLYGGVVAGGTGALLGFWGMALPPIYLLGLSTRKPPLPKSIALPAQVKDKECFELGYQQVARKKKIQRSAVAALGGLVGVWLIKVASGGLK